ncbi:TPA: hypothetical protein HA265_07485 [Candidatus Woesearchaeota archaeon]|nr:hypothetical protein [Candidatus Woesearchaeota archaeon]
MNLIIAHDSDELVYVEEADLLAEKQGIPTGAIALQDLEESVDDAYISLETGRQTVEIPPEAYEGLLNQGIQALAHMYGFEGVQPPERFETRTDFDLPAPQENYQFSIAFTGKENLEQISQMVKDQMRKVYDRSPNFLKRIAAEAYNKAMQEKEEREATDDGEKKKLELSEEELEQEGRAGITTPDDSAEVPLAEIIKQITQVNQEAAEKAEDMLFDIINDVTDHIVDVMYERSGGKQGDDSPDIKGAYNISFKFKGDHVEDVDLRRTAFRSRFLYRLIGKKIATPDTTHITDEGEREDAYLEAAYKIADSLIARTGFQREEGRDMFIDEVTEDDLKDPDLERILSERGKELVLAERFDGSHADYSLRELLAEEIASAFHHCDTQYGEPIKIDVIFNDDEMPEASGRRFYLNQGEGVLEIEIPEYEDMSYRDMFADVTERYLEAMAGLFKPDIQWDDQVQRSTLNLLPVFIYKSRNGFAARPKGGFTVQIPFKNDAYDQLHHGGYIALHEQREGDDAYTDEPEAEQ